MKNVLLYNYEIEPENICKLDELNYSFYIDYYKFYFTATERPEADLREIFAMMPSIGQKYHQIVQNKFSSFITPYKGKNFILLKVNGPENSEIDILDILRDTIPYNNPSSSLVRTNWGELWSAKVDYLEYQISELGTTHRVARHSFSYYAGLAENAISYVNMLDTKDLETVISHRRIRYPFRSKEYYDPLDLVVDYRSRDYSSYFKMKFFHCEDIMREVRILTDKNILTPLEYNLLFARLLYPSYYFDALGTVLERGEDDDILLEYINKVDEYEKFLKNTYEIFKSKCSMIKIDWLLKTS